MFFIELTTEERQRVRQRVQNGSVTNQKSITYKRELGNLAGFTGEAIFQKYRPDAIPTPNSMDHDFILKDVKIDVKSRASDLEPRPHWDCKIPAYSVEVQECDVYVFTIVRSNGNGGYLLGWLPKSDFRELASAVSASELLTGYVHGRVVNADLLVVRISDLRPFPEQEEQDA